MVLNPTPKAHAMNEEVMKTESNTPGIPDGSQAVQLVEAVDEVYTTQSKPLIHALFEKEKREFYMRLGADRDAKQWQDPRIEWSSSGVFESYVLGQIDFLWFKRGYIAALAQPRPVGVPDAIVKLAAIECARRAYGYWRGDSTGGDSAMRYFDENRGLAGISHNIDMMESAIRKHIAAAPAPAKAGEA